MFEGCYTALITPFTLFTLFTLIKLFMLVTQFTLSDFFLLTFHFLSRLRRYKMRCGATQDGTELRSGGERSVVAVRCDGRV